MFGSRLLENFDSALLPYAVATVFLAFGVAYRYTVRVSAPGARRLFKQGWRSFFSVANFCGCSTRRTADRRRTLDV